ncbi:MAG TPA: hypothetical protein VMJ65_02745 [Solirubrobacteraceae bacterium]|nr:hypothetical protein [Solirubrobacteraceae bacterium]
MHGYETLMDPAEATASPNVEPYAVGLAAPVQQGDFAAGMRTRAHDAGPAGTYATGMSGALTPAARRIGDFASRTRSDAGPRAIGDFATGMRARTDVQPRPQVADPQVSDRDREPHWASV